MLKILDRYLIREIAAAAAARRCSCLTFVLMIPPILQNGEQLIAKGVAVVDRSLRVLLTLMPQALGVTIPMALLLAS